MDNQELAKLQLYQMIAAIPHGRVASYGQLAHLAGRSGAARWVGYCCGIYRPTQTYLGIASSLPMANWPLVSTAITTNANTSY